MPNFCSFVMRARGDASDLHALQCLLERGRNGNSLDGDVILDFELVFPKDVVGMNEIGHPILAPDLGHTFLWIHDRGVPPMASIEGNVLSLSGDSKWCPPSSFMNRLSVEFPGLDFYLSGTTEYERREVLHAKGGNCFCRYDQFGGNLDEQEDPEWHAWDGLVLDTGYVLNYLL